MKLNMMKNDSLQRVSVGKLIIILVLAGFLGAAGLRPAAGAEVNPPCPETGARPHLILNTRVGSITIELFEDAAPQTVKRLIKMARGPIFNPQLTSSSSGNPGVGYFDGLGFSMTKPHLEISITSRLPESQFEFPAEIDADALGLDQQLIADAGEAMDIAQMELYPAHRKLKKRGGTTGKLRAWLDQLTQDGNADFLVGISRKEINEALGYRYRDGLVSRPAVRGMVALRPLSKTTAGGSLTILLADHPQRTGRWMIVGRIVDGLSVAEEISLLPLSGPPGWRNRAFTPRDPVLITESEIHVCQTGNSEGGK